MKHYRKKGKCYCGGPESCNLCRPDKRSKRQVRKRVRQKIKKLLKNI